MSDPFSEPAPPGSPPYHLRQFDDVAEAKHLRLIVDQRLPHGNAAVRPRAPGAAPFYMSPPAALLGDPNGPQAIQSNDGPGSSTA